MKKGLSFSSAKAEFTSVYGSDKVSETFIRKYYTEFKHGRENIFDEPRPGRPLEIDHSGIAAGARSAIDADPKATTESLSVIFNVSKGTMLDIIHKELGLRNLSAKWVPHMLNQAQKQQWWPQK